jgi:hypothetical protein
VRSHANDSEGSDPGHGASGGIDVHSRSSGAQSIAGTQFPGLGASASFGQSVEQPPQLIEVSFRPAEGDGVRRSSNREQTCTQRSRIGVIGDVDRACSFN